MLRQLLQLLRVKDRSDELDLGNDDGDNDKLLLSKDKIHVEAAVRLGSGTFGRVYKGLLFGETVALKILKGDFSSPNARKEFKQEVQMLKALSHENVISLRGVCLDPPCIVTEYCCMGSLELCMQKWRHAVQSQLQPSPEGSRPSPDTRRRGRKNWKRRLKLVIGIARGMYYLHYRRRTIIHRDLKSPNVLLKRGNTPTITDFGLATHKVARIDFNLNPKWGAPEVVLDGEDACPLSDVYSFGIVMWEILTGAQPWEGFFYEQILYRMMRNERPEVPGEVPMEDWLGVEKYVELMKRCWEQDRKDRPNFEEIVQELSQIWLQVVAPGRPRGETMDVGELAETVAPQELIPHDQDLELPKQGAFKSLKSALKSMLFCGGMKRGALDSESEGPPSHLPGLGGPTEAANDSEARQIELVARNSESEGPPSHFPGMEGPSEATNGTKTQQIEFVARNSESEGANSHLPGMEGPSEAANGTETQQIELIARNGENEGPPLVFKERSIPVRQ